MEKTEHVENCGDGRFELIDKIKEDIIRATNITKDEEKVLSNILFRLCQRDWLRSSNDIDDMEAKATAYDRIMSGGKKTLKEWANMFGMVVAVDQNREAACFGHIPVMYLNEGEGIWTNSPKHYGEETYLLPPHLIDFDGDWKDSLTLPDGWEEL